VFVFYPEVLGSHAMEPGRKFVRDFKEPTNVPVVHTSQAIQ